VSKDGRSGSDPIDGSVPEVRAYSDLQKQDVRLIQTLFTLLPLPVAVVASDSKILTANSSFCDLFPEVSTIRNFPRHDVRAGGRTYEFETTPLNDDGLSALIGRDTTGESQLRERLIYNEKMATVGRLVSGLVHELNSPLTSIAGYAELLTRSNLDEPSARMAGVMKNHAERVERIIQSFLGLTRSGAQDRTPTSVNQVVDNVLRLREHEHTVRDVHVSRVLADPLPSVLADAGQIEQVVLNLIVNAEDMVASLQAGAGEIRVRTSLTDGRVRLEVTDNGDGIESGEIGRIFDPHQTTRRNDGTRGEAGMGLGICSEIVKDHGGELFTWSDYGHGTTFVMELPSYQGRRASEAGDVQANQDSRSLDGKTVMVIDDEISITNLIEESLTRSGARVDVFNSGWDAFVRLSEQPYDVIVTDRMMPGISGEQLYHMVRSMNPELAERIIFITGDVSSEACKSFLGAGDVRYLLKPFRLRALLDVVRSVSSVRA